MTDPTTPVVNNDPNYSSQSSCVSAMPQDQGIPSYNVQSLARDGSGNVTVVLASGTVFVPQTTGNFGKGWVVLSGFSDTSLNEGPVKILTVRTSAQANDTITYHSASITATSVTNQGVATATYSSCVPDSNGQGCAPNSIHSTGNVAFLPNPSDPTRDVFFKASGSLACGPGNQVRDTWTLPLSSMVSNASPWTLQNSVSTYSAPSGAPSGFPNVTEYDAATGLVYVMDHAADNSLYAYDLFGTKGAPNTWYKLTGVDGFQNSHLLSGTIWHSDGGTQSLFFAVGGCKAIPIASISRSSGTATANLAYSNGLVVGTRIVVYEVSDSSFNGGDGTNVYATINAVNGNQINYNVGNATSTSSAGGKVVTCDSQDVHGINGVLVADITAGTASVAKDDWTYATLDANNVDTGDTTLGNTCAEYLSGGAAPLNGDGSLTGGISPGITIDNVTNKIVGWPNEGTNIYQITPDPVNKRWTCKRESYGALDSTAAPANTSNNGGVANSTWGTWHRFTYFPSSDVFFLVNAPDQPARILRIR